jgi:hypothetical protein
MRIKSIRVFEDSEKKFNFGSLEEKMKKTIFGFTNKYSAILPLLIVFLVILGCGGKPEMPAEADTQNLVKTTTADFADAIDKQDFATFREKASKELSSQYTNDQMKTTFKDFVENKDQIVPILRDASKMNAKFSPAPAIREEKGNYILVTDGSFDTKPVPTRFTNEYVWQDGKWKLLKINVQL